MMKRVRIDALGKVLDEILDVRRCHFESNSDGEGEIPDRQARAEQHRLNELVHLAEMLYSDAMEVEP